MRSCSQWRRRKRRKVPSNVIPFRKACARCKQPGDDVELTWQPGTRIERRIPFVACRKCMQKMMEDFAAEQVVFEQLLALDIDRDTANVMMLAKHRYEREQAQKRQGGHK